MLLQLPLKVSTTLQYIQIKWNNMHFEFRTAHQNGLWFFENSSGQVIRAV